MKLGISTYALTWSIGVHGYESPRNPLNAIDILNIAKVKGLHLVQYADNLPLHLLNDSELREIKIAANEYNVDIEIGTRGTSPELLLKYLEICKLLKSSLLRTLITTPDITQAQADILRVLPKFIESGVTIAIENHGLQTAKQLTQLFDIINSEYVKCCLDTVNSFGALEGSEYVIQTLIPYIANLHIKDFDIRRVDHQMGFEILGTPAGQGRLDLNHLFDLLKKYEKRSTAVLELWTPYTNSVDETIILENIWFEQSLNYLTSFTFR